MTVTLPAITLQAASLCVEKNPTRLHITGVYLDVDAGAVVATNGHLAFIEYINLRAAGLNQSAILGVGKVPQTKRFHSVTFDTGVACWRANGPDDVRTAYTKINGQYPDWEFLLPPDTPPESSTSAFGVNTRYLALLQKTIGRYDPNGHVVITVRHPERDPIEIRPRAAKADVLMLLMPVKIGS